MWCNGKHHWSPQDILTCLQTKHETRVSWLFNLCFFFPCISSLVPSALIYLVHSPEKILNTVNTVFSACSLSGRALPYYRRLQEGFQPGKEVLGTCWDWHKQPHPFKPFGRSVSEQVFPLRDVIFHLLTSGMEIKKEPVSVDHASVGRNPAPDTAEKILCSSFPSTLLSKLKKHFSFEFSVKFRDTLLHKKGWCNERFCHLFTEPHGAKTNTRHLPWNTKQVSTTQLKLAMPYRKPHLQQHGDWKLLGFQCHHSMEDSKS